MRPPRGVAGKFRKRRRDKSTVAALVDILEDRTLLSAPTAYDDSISTVHDQSIFGDVSVNAFDPEFDPLTFSVVSLPANGTLKDSSGSPLSAGASFDGTYQYVPSALFVGADSFTWKAFDGTSYSNVATVSISVTNNAPTDSDSSHAILHDQELFWGVSSEDADFDELTYKVDTLPTHGTLKDGNGTPLFAGSTFDGNYQYVPSPSFVGSDSFTWHASDGLANSDGATVTIRVTLSA